jgi:hypothetical protein
MELDLPTDPSASQTQRLRTAQLTARCLLGQRSIPRSSCTSPPEVPACSRESPQRQSQKALRTLGIPADARSARKRHDRPVTPEVAGSSPVAPAQKRVQIARFFSYSASVLATKRRPGNRFGNISRRNTGGMGKTLE